MAIPASFLAILLVLTGCGADDCGSCGEGPINGFMYKKVTAEDLGKLPEVEVVVDDCIRYQPGGDDEIDPATVEVVSKCCCDLY